MAKVLLVEDDNNLREIFEMRLQAEGYQTVTAGDGEEALVVAMREKPDLIISDVMMPKMSGFEMLETLRKTPEMAKIKVIMMTALGQAEDQARGAKLGVIKYLVKSQVTLEDFARVVREVLVPGSGTNTPAAAGTSSTTDDSVNNNKVESEQHMDDTTPTNPSPTTPPAAPDAGNPISDPAPAGMTSGQPTEAQEQSTVQSQINNFASSSPASSPAPAPDAGTTPPPSPTSGDVPVSPAPDPMADPSAPAPSDGPTGTPA